MKFIYRLAMTISLSATTLIVSAQTDTVINLKEIQFMDRTVGLHSSRINPIKVETINSSELCKAACCNLSESFETNPSVDVSYSDAATGAKQIRLLGLMGTYVQLISENVPFIRGLASPYGLSYVPGPWMESIQISKGAASVINGYEAITGQINVEYKKPSKSDLLSLNLFMADNMRTEANGDLALKLTPYLSTSTFLHYENETMEHDANGDGFMDLPGVKQLSVFNRWYYQKKKYTSQFGIKYLDENRQSGQLQNINTVNPYRIEIGTKRLEVFAKNGYVFDSEKNTSLGLILSGSFHGQESGYGLNKYDANQTNLYGNLIFQTNIDDKNKIVVGTSLLADNLDETMTNRLSYLNPDDPYVYDSERTEITPGLFAEYSLNLNDKIHILAGLRYDHSNWFGGFITPRLHVKYDVADWFHLRGNVGKGYRTTNLISENSYMLASSRVFRMRDNKLFYQEEALNAGLSAMFYIPVSEKDMTLTLEAYNTHFMKQMINDMDYDKNAVYFYELSGKSYSNAFQAELNYELIRGLQLTAAIRYIDAKSTYNQNPATSGSSYQGVLRERPLTNKYKGLFTASWQSPMKRWQFDTNIQLNGGSRLPDLNGENNRRNKPFTIINAQLTKYFRWGSIYGGSENLTGFRQKDPISGAYEPWGNDFDATMVWGPVHGRKLYLGLRYAIKNKSNDKL